VILQDHATSEENLDWIPKQYAKALENDEPYWLSSRLIMTARQAKKSARKPLLRHAFDGKIVEPLRSFLRLIKQTQLYAKNNLAMFGRNVKPP